MRSDVADEVHVHGYDLFADVAPGQPTRISFRADIVGRFDIELEDRALPLVDLRVQSVTPLLAHGIGSVQDLPVPLWLFYYGAALVLLVSFLALWALWPKPRLEGATDSVRSLPPWAQRILLSPALRIALGAISFTLLVVVAVAALVGERSPSENFAPTFIYVVFWLGLVPLVVVFGNMWTSAQPVAGGG